MCPFSASTAAKILGLSPTETLVLLEGLVTSAVIFVVDEEAKEVMYDIHPLLKRYADSIKDHENFRMAYLEAKGTIPSALYVKDGKDCKTDRT